jgi:hypothetical protein
VLKRARLKTPAHMVIWWYIRPGVGLSPSPNPPNQNTKCNLNSFQNHIYNKNTMCGAMVGRPLKDFPTLVGGPGFDPHGLHNILPNTQTNNKGATWQPMPGPRGTIPFAKMMPHVTTSFIQNLPINDCHIINYHLSIQTCHVSCTASATSAVRTIQTVQSTHFFFCLFDDSNRTRYLTHLTSV